MGNNQQIQQQKQQKEQQKPPKSNSGITQLSNDLLYDDNLKHSKLFGKPIYVCYIPRNKQLLQLDRVAYDVQINNGEPADVEFLFSVPPNSVIIKLEAQIGNKRVLALIKEIEEAITWVEYEFEKDRIQLYTEDYSDIIKANIGNLGPQETIQITYQYIEQLQVQVNEFWRLQIDPVFNPRYNQSQRNYLNNLFNIEQFNYNYVYDIIVIFNGDFVYIRSPTHQIVIEQLQSGSLVTLNNEQQNNKNQDPQGTFILLFQNKNIHTPLIQLTHTNNDQLQHQKYCATMQFIPMFNPLQLDDAYEAYQELNDNESNFYELNAKGEYIFVLDRSGSMAGKRINNVKQALNLFLQSLPLDSYFNIVSFGSQAQSHYEKSLKYNQKSLKKTLKKLIPLKADMGQTEINKCLLKVLGIERIEGYTRNIFILTDGGDADSESLLKIVSENAKPDVRLYSIGIGKECCRCTINKIAFLGNGLHHIVADNEDLNSKVIDLLQDSITPQFQYFSFETNIPNQSLIVSNVINMNCIKKNTPLTIQILFQDDETVESQRYFFKLTYYDQNMKQYGFHSDIELNKSIENENYHKLAIGMQFQQILKNARLYQNEYKSIYSKGLNVTKQDIIDLSLSYQVLSPYTAFICEIVELNEDLYQNNIILIKAKIEEKVRIQKYQYETFEMFISRGGTIMHTCDIRPNGQPSCYAIQRPVQFTQQINMQTGLIEERVIEESMPGLIRQTEIYSMFPKQEKYEMKPEKCVMNEKYQKMSEKQQMGSNRMSYFEIVNKFNLNGSIKDSIINLLNLKKEDFKLKIHIELQLLIAALATLEIWYKDDKDTWILVFIKGVTYLKQNNIVYKQVKKEVIQMLKLNQ